jgi:hypothetical protein
VGLFRLEPRVIENRSNQRLTQINRDEERTNRRHHVATGRHVEGFLPRSDVEERGSDHGLNTKKNVDGSSVPGPHCR